VHVAVSALIYTSVSSFVEKAASSAFLKLLFTKDQRISRIEGYYNRIGDLMDSFQVCCNVFETASFINAAGATDIKNCGHSWVAGEE
jgi:hypothetical protein